MHEAGYFHAISKPSKITVSLVHLSGRIQTGDEASHVLTAMNEVKYLDPDIILLYTAKKNMELILQQKVFHGCFFFPSFVTLLFLLFIKMDERTFFT